MLERQKIALLDKSDNLAPIYRDQSAVIETALNILASHCNIYKK